MANSELNVRTKQETSGDESTRPGRTYVPDVDIYESDQSLWLWADMPGVNEKSIDIGLANGVLSISGQVATEEYDTLSPVYTEYNVGNYFRRFTLPDAIDTEHIAARVSNGVLSLELPKAERAKPRRITVAAD